MTMLDASCGAIEHKQPTRGAIGQRVLRDLLGRKNVIEIGETIH